MSPSNSNPFAVPGSSPPATMDQTLYFCVAKGGRILHCYNPAGDGNLAALAARCLACAPPFHSRYSHTADGRTYGFLIEDGYTYFAIADAARADTSAAAAAAILESIRDGFKKDAKTDELIPVIRSLITSLECMSRSDRDPAPGHGSASRRMSSIGSGRMDRKMKDRAIDHRDANDGRADREVKIEVAAEPAVAAGAVALQKSASSKTRGQQAGRRLWCRHVKIVIAVDVFLCLVLFGVWMMVCRGFQCVSS